MRGRFKKCLASIMAVLMMCSVYVVPAGAAGAEPTQDEGEWDNILWSPNGSSVDSQGLCWFFSVYSLPKGAIVKWTVDEDSSKYDVELESGSTGSSTTDGVSNANVVRVNSPVYNGGGHGFKVTVKVYDKNKNLKRTFGQTVEPNAWVNVILTPPEDVDLNAMELGTYRFTAEQMPSNAPTSIYYTLQNADGTPVSESAASVDKNGNVTLKAPGTYTLKAEPKSTADGIHSYSDSITFTCDANPGKYFIEQKEGGTVPASIKVGDTLSLVLVKEIEEAPVINAVQMPPNEVEYIRQNGVINMGQAAKPIYAIKAKDLPSEDGIRISTGEKELFETVIGNTQTPGILWSNDSGPYAYEFVEDVDLKEVVEGVALEGIPAAGEAQSEGTSDSYYIGVGNSVTVGTGLDFVATRTGVAYKWAASNDCVTIGSDGVLKGIKPGTVKITGSYKDYDNDGMEGSVSVELEVEDNTIGAIQTGQGDEGKTSGNNMGIQSGGSTDEKPMIEEPDPEIKTEGDIVLDEGYEEREYQYSVKGIYDTLRVEGPSEVVLQEDGKIIIGQGLVAEKNYNYNTKNYKFTIIAGRGSKEFKKNVNISVQGLPPHIGGESNSIELQEGYSRYNTTFWVVGTLSGEVVSLSNDKAEIDYEGIYRGASMSYNVPLIIRPGLPVGTYSFIITAENKYGTGTLKVQVTVIPKKTAPQITGKGTINLEVGYQPVQYDYEVTGEPKPTVSLLEDGNTATATMTNGVVTIPQDLGVGSYSFTLQAENSEGKDSKTVEVNVYEKPQITGEATISLEEGYSSVPYKYGVTGYPKPAVSILAEGNGAKAVMDGGKVTIPSGLEAGSYSFTLQAENTAGTAAKTVTVVVAPEKKKPQITGAERVNLEEGYGPVPYEYSVTGEPEPTVRILAEGNTAKAVMEEGKVTIPSGLEAGSYSFTLQAENAAGTATKTVTVVVAPEKEKPAISGERTIYLDEGYRSVRYNYTVTGYPKPEVNVLPEGNSAGATISNGIVTIPAGLDAGLEYTFTLVAENSEGSDSMRVTVVVRPKVQPTDPDPDPIVPADVLTPKQLLQSTEQKSDIQNEKDPVKEPAEDAEPAEEPAQKEAASAEEPEKEAASPEEPAKKEEPVKEPAKEEETTEEPAVKDESPKLEPAS